MADPAAGAFPAVRPGWLDSGTVAALIGGYERLVDEALRQVRYASRDQCERRFSVWPVQSTEAPWRGLLTPELLALAAELLGVPGGAVRLYGVWVLVKPPQTVAIAPWHQDFVFWPSADRRGLTLWWALDGAPEEGGALRYLQASEQGEAQIAVPARPGDLLIHDGETWHTAGPNCTDERRRAVVVMVGHPDVAPMADWPGPGVSDGAWTADRPLLRPDGQPQDQLLAGLSTA